MAKKLSNAPDYPEICVSALKEMFKQTGPPVFDKNEILQKGVIIRHLVLPGYLQNSVGILETVAALFKPEEVLLSVMSQFTPYPQNTLPELNRRLKPLEYKYIVSKVLESGFNGYIQDLSSAREEYTPKFK